jgi:hypothetical protein
MADPHEWDEESDQLAAADTLDGAVPDPLDVGIPPPERPWVGDGWGVTAVHVVGDAPPDDDGPSPADLRRLGRGRGVSDR